MSIALPSATTRSGRGRSLRDGLRRVAEAAVTPLEISDVLDVFHPLRGGRDGLQGKVVSVTPETAESATILIKPGRDWAGHVPGQYVRIGVDVDGVRLWRTYSLTHGPRPDGHVSITVKGIPDGVVSNHLVHRTRPGTMLQLGPHPLDRLRRQAQPVVGSVARGGHEPMLPPVLSPANNCDPDLHG